MRKFTQQMSFKHLIYILVIPAVILTACTGNKSKRAEAISGIPSSAAVIIEVNRFDKLYQGLEKSGWVKLSEKDDLFQKSNAQLQQLSQALLKNPESQSFFTSSPFFVSLHMIGTNHSTFLFTRGIGDQSTQWQQIQEKIRQSYQPQAREYDGATIFSAKVEEIDLVYSSYQNVLFISPEVALIEDAIRQINSGISLLQDARFKKLRSTANKKDDANIYVQYKNAPDFFGQFFSKGQTSWLKDLSQWTELDMVCKSDGLLMNGLSFSSDSIHHTLTLFSDNDPQRLSLFEVAPKNTAIAVFMGVNDFGKYHQKYKEQLRANNQLMRYLKNVETIGKVEDVENDFLSWIESEFGFFITETKTAPAENSFAVFKTKDQQLAIRSLGRLSNDYTEKYRGYQLNQISYNSLFGTLMGDLFQDIKKPYYTALDNYIVFANSQAGLRAVINSWLARNTLAYDNHFSQFYDHLNPRSNVLVYAKNPAAWKLYGNYTEGKINGSSLAAKASAAALQFSVQNDLAYTNAFLFLKENQQADTRINWTAQLDTALLGKPHVVINHYNQKKEVLVQDIGNTLYHFDTYGQLLWKRDLGETIMGDIHMVDMFKNNKYQFLFTTKNHIYLLDRKGRNVENYPINLKSSATLPLALFDFDNNRKYRIAQVCGKKVYYYNIEGKIVGGWKFTETPTNISMIPQHFSAYGKDFILFPEESGKVNILNRQGKPRVKPDYDFSLSGNKFYLEKAKKLSSSRLITTGKEGQLYYIFMNDQIDVVNQQVLTQQHFFAQKENSRITYDQGTLRLETEEDVFRYDFSDTPVLEFVLPEGTKSAFIGAVDSENGKVYVFNRKAELLEGFPIYGTSLFHITDLDKDGKLNLVVGSKEGSVYNYTIE